MWPLVFLPQIVVLLMALEAGCIYAVMHSYAKAYHRYSPSKGVMGFGSSELSELWVLLANLLLSVLAASTSAFILIGVHQVLWPVYYNQPPRRPCR